jgi:putative Holliday junction resolvase
VSGAAPGRIAAVDYGRKRVGLAVCDPLRIAVRGLPTVRASGAPPETVAAVAKALRDEGVARVVVGLPLHDDGRESVRSKEARAFAADLAKALGVDVVFHDEGLTTWEAEEAVKETGERLRDAKRRGEVDRAAAVVLLRSYLRTIEGAGGPR